MRETHSTNATAVAYSRACGVDDALAQPPELKEYLP